MYLQFVTIGESGYINRKYVEDFENNFKKEGITFQNIAWHELFINLAKTFS